MQMGFLSGCCDPGVDLHPVTPSIDLDSSGNPSSCGRIRIRNLGETDAPPSTTRFSFSNGGEILVPTGAIPSCSSIILEFELPSECFAPSDCTYTVTVDAENVVSEADEENNQAGDTCIG